MSSAEPFDVERLLAQVDGDRLLLGAVLEAFRQEWPRRATEATTAFARSDADGARRALHALAGMLAQLGAEVAPAVVAVERLVKAGELQQAERAWGQTENELRSLDRSVCAVLEPS